MNSDTPDPITVLRVRLADETARRVSYYLCPRSLATRLAADAASSGDDVSDLGPGALILAQAAQQKRAEYGKGTMVLVGVARGSKWLHWYPPSPREPVPGSPGARAARN